MHPLSTAADAGSGAIRPVLLFAAAGIPLLVLAAHAQHYLPFLADDALISLRYADRLLAGEGLTWTAGERVEGYSNLLWILCVALLGRFGVDLIDATRILGFSGMAAAIAAVVVFLRPRDARSTLVAFGAGMSLALSGAIAVWTVGGLEQPLLIALVAWATVLCVALAERGDSRLRAAVVPGVLLGLACWTRPDTPIFVVVLAGLLAGLGGFTRTRLRQAGALAAVAFGFSAAQLAFRLLYYGDWLPNPARVKLAFSAARWHEGLDYLALGLVPLAGLAIPALLAIGVATGTSAGRRRVAWFGVPALAWAAYVAAIGGDLFPGRRHQGILVVFLALLAAEFFARIPRLGVAAAALAAALALLGALQWKHDPEHQRARAERWEWDGEVVGRLLQRAFGEQQPLLAVTAAGCLPYFSRLPSLDMLGLNDRYLATHPPADVGTGALGHELGDGAYVLAREPDLVIFCSPAGGARPCFRSDSQLAALPEFRQRYRLVDFLGSDPHAFRSSIWVRTDSPKTGVVRTPDSQQIPGYLLTTSGVAVARLDGAGRIGMQLASGDAGLSGEFELAPGDWRVRVESSGELVTSILRDGRQVARLAAAESARIRLEPGETGAVEVAIRGAGHVRRVVFERP